MVIGHAGERGRGALWHVAVDLKFDWDHVPIHLHKMIAMIAEETRLSLSHVTQIVVQVIEICPSSLSLDSWA